MPKQTPSPVSDAEGSVFEELKRVAEKLDPEAPEFVLLQVGAGLAVAKGATSEELSEFFDALHAATFRAESETDNG